MLIYIRETGNKLTKVKNRVNINIYLEKIYKLLILHKYKLIKWFL